MFGRRNHIQVTTDMHTRRGGIRNPFHRRDPDRVAGGFKAALANPHTTRHGRKEAERSLRRMGRGNEIHVPFMTKVKRTLGIRSTPKRNRATISLAVPTTPTRRRFGRRY